MASVFFRSAGRKNLIACSREHGGEGAFEFADGVSYTAEAQEKLKRMENDSELKEMGTCMVKGVF